MSTELPELTLDQLAVVSGGASQNDQLMAMLTQLTQSIQAAATNNQSDSMPMMMMMMMMMGGGGGHGTIVAPAAAPAYSAASGAATYINVHASLPRPPPQFFGGGFCCGCKGW